MFQLLPEPATAFGMPVHLEFTVFRPEIDVIAVVTMKDLHAAFIDPVARVMQERNHSLQILQ